MTRVPFIFAGLALTCALAQGVTAASDPNLDNSTNRPNFIQHSRPGPWGSLVYVRTTLELPDHFANEFLDAIQPTSWFFANRTEEQVVTFLKSCGLPPGDESALLNRHTWTHVQGGIRITPDHATVLRLSPETRAKIYSELATSSNNGLHFNPYLFRPQYLPQRFERSGLSDRTIALFKQLLYPRGSLMLFSDTPALADQISDPREKMRLIKTISRRETMLIRLEIKPESDIEALLGYWGVGGRAKDLRPLLESLTRVPEGWSIDVAHLLPSFPRQKLYTFPNPTSASCAIPKENCHWTSFNFFNNPPDDKFRGFQAVQNALDSDYDVVTESARQLGDVMLVVDSTNAIAHSAVYIADDIVFTKNGGRENQPWIFMKLEDMLAFYDHKSNPVHVEACRRKDLKN